MDTVGLGKEELSVNVDDERDSMDPAFSEELFGGYINCADCGSDFAFSAAERIYFDSNNFKNVPRRCHNCRVLRRAKGGSRRGSGSISALVCASCYCLTYVPFKPNGEKPVYCTTCLYNPKLDLCV